ncbi:hypothetical protein OROMI_029583 [Orobanche minor]
MSQSSSTSGGGPTRCNCGLPIAAATSWKDSNPGRRFIGCQNYPNEGHCKFFRWTDPPICDRAKQIMLGRLNDVREQMRRLELQNAHLEEENRLIKHKKSGLEEDNILLTIHNMELIEEVKLLKNANKMKKRKKMAFILVVVFLVLILSSCWLKLDNIEFVDVEGMKMLP